MSKITVDDLAGYTAELVLAAVASQDQNKRLSVEVYITRNNTPMTKYIVRDLNRPEDKQIVECYYDLDDAIDAYNAIR